MGNTGFPDQPVFPAPPVPPVAILLLKIGRKSIITFQNDVNSALRYHQG